MPRRKPMKELGIYQKADEVQKSNHLIQYKNPLTALQRKSFLFILQETINQIKKNKGAKDFYRIDYKSYQKAMGYNSNDIGFIRNSLDDLMDKKLHWIDPDDGGEVHSRCMASFKIIDGVIEWALSYHLKERILKAGFTLLKMSYIMQFKSTYSIALYETVSKWRDRGWIELELQAFRDLMGIEDSQYKAIDNLKRKVLNIAINEINATSDLMLRCEDIKSVRKIIGFRFEFIKMTKQQLKVREDREILNEKYLKDKKIQALFGMEYNIGGKWYKLTKSGLIYRKKVAYNLVDTIALFKQFDKDKMVIEKRRK